MDGGESRARVTIRTVAADAGVSVSAVSKVLRNAYGISDDLRKRVNASIERLGYRPSMAARSMRGRTYTIGVLLVEMENPFLPKVVAGIDETLGAANFKTMMAVGQADLRIETSLIDSMIDFRMDGIVLVAPRLKGAQLASYAARTPMAVIGHHEPQTRAFDTVNSDDVAAVRQIVRRLHAEGRRRIEMVSLRRESNDSDVIHQREIGYRTEMAALGLERETVIHRAEERDGRRAASVTEILDRPGQPDAYFCWSDQHGVELISQARARGIDIPGVLAVVGFDDTPLANLPQIGLSSYNHDGYRQGAEAARCLLSRLEGRGDPLHLLIGGHLVERSSLGARPD